MSEPVRIIVADVLAGLAQLADQSVHCCVTSPPYWGLRDYGVEGQIGLEPTPEAFVARMVEVFAAVRRVLRDDGTVFLNLGDSYAGNGGGGGTPSESLDKSTDRMIAEKRTQRLGGLKPKDLCMIPWRVALALQADGWYLRSVIVWHKRSPMPESVTDRPTSSWEPIFLMAKSERYFYDAEAIREEPKPWNNGQLRAPKLGAERIHGAGEAGTTEKQYDEIKGANRRNVWPLSAEPYAEAHFATFPSEIPRRAIKAGTSEKGCCPECGTGWVRVVERSGGGYINPEANQRRRDDIGEHLGRTQTSGGVIPATVKTLGWDPGCSCVCPAPDSPCEPHNPIPCVVLDPFLGSGTTLAVARQLGRRGIGIELNPAYAELARIRIGKAEKPLTYQDPRVKDSPLFTEAL